jgi:hypothetical protein
MAEKKAQSADEALRAEAAKAARKVEKSPIASDNVKEAMRRFRKGLGK